VRKRSEMGSALFLPVAPSTVAGLVSLVDYVGSSATFSISTQRAPWDLLIVAVCPGLSTRLQLARQGLGPPGDATRRTAELVGTGLYRYVAQSYLRCPCRRGVMLAKRLFATSAFFVRCVVCSPFHALSMGSTAPARSEVRERSTRISGQRPARIAGSSLEGRTAPEIIVTWRHPGGW